tara:strand:+ start:50847 stop:51746 length:900 start_codon:yes stop_codon:yes gene_type:complete
MTKRKFIILGHTGFIGARLLTKLSVLSDTFEVQGLSLEQLDLTKVNSNLDLATIFTPDSTLVMCAAVKKQLGDTPETFAKNMAIIQNLIRLLQSHPVRRIVYLSSAAIYGEDIENLRITENTPPHPRSYYGLSKFNAEWMLQKAVSSTPNTELGIVRPATIYGPGDVANAYGPSGFLNAALSGEEIVLWGDGSEKREFLYIDDVIDILSQYIISDETNLLNIASGTSYTFQDVLDAVQAVVARMPTISSQERSKEKVDNCFDPSRLLTLMPDYKFTSLVSGIKKMYQQISNNEKQSKGQ